MTQGFPAFSIQTSACLAAFGLLALFATPGCNKKPAEGAGAALPPTTVLAVEAKRAPIAETLALVGTLAGNETVEVKSETEGTIAEILFSEGQPVKKGDLLIRLDDSKLAASLAEAQANLELSATTFERSKVLYRDKLISQQEFDQAAATYQAHKASVELRRRQLADARIFAPFSGVTGSRTISPGQVISKDTTLTWLVDLEIVKAEFNVPERFLSEVKPGQEIQLTVAAYPKQRFTGEVYFLAPQVDPNTRTLLLKARVANPERRLKPGMFANLDLTLTLRQDAVVIPESALISQGERTSVYVINAEGKAQMRPVKVGLRTANQIEVKEGLAVGEKVVTEGIQKVRPGAQVQIAAPPNSPPGTNVAKRS